MKRTNTPKSAPAENSHVKVSISPEQFTVSNVRDFGNVVYFNLAFYGMSFYGLRVVDGEKGDFISFPQRKGKDGKYYNHFFIPFADETKAAIIAAVEKELNA